MDKQRAERIRKFKQLLGESVENFVEGIEGKKPFADSMTVKCLACDDDIDYRNGNFCDLTCEYAYQDGTDGGITYEETSSDDKNHRMRQYRTKMLKQKAEQGEARKRAWDDAKKATEETERGRQPMTPVKKSKK